MKDLACLALTLACACTNPVAQELNPSMPPQARARPAACEIGGCNGTECGEPGQSALTTTCLYKQEHACYRDARCERQPDGACGWSRDADLVACLANPPPVAGPEQPPPPPVGPIAEEPAAGHVTARPRSGS